MAVTDMRRGRIELSLRREELDRVLEECDLICLECGETRHPGVAWSPGLRWAGCDRCGSSEVWSVDEAWFLGTLREYTVAEQKADER